MTKHNMHIHLRSHIYTTTPLIHEPMLPSSSYYSSRLFQCRKLLSPSQFITKPQQQQQQQLVLLVIGGEYNSGSDTTPFTRSITFGRDYGPEPFDSEKLPVTLVSQIQRFLRIANLIEFDEPRVAYLCRFHAFEVAHNLDRNSSGRGVRQFKTSLLQRLEMDEEVTITKRKEKSDIRELRRVYREYKDYIIKHGGEGNLLNRQKLIKAREISSVLYEVLNTVSNATGSQALADGDRAKSEFYVPYNILPLDPGGVHQAIMQLSDV